jgi:hypothetical protein
MTGAKKTEKATASLGTLVKAKTVVRPDGSEISVSDGYVLDVPGVHVIDGEEVTAV